MTSEHFMDWGGESPSQRPMLQSPAEGRLVSYTLPAPGISARTFLQYAQGQERVYWQSGKDETFFAGFGVAVQMMAWGAGRFQEIQHKMKNLFREAVWLNKQPQHVGPRFIGGFSFNDDFTPDNAWAVFHPAHFILPHYQLVKTDEGRWLTINALLVDDDELGDIRRQLHEALQARLDQITRAHASEQNSDTSIVCITYPMTYDDWSGSISEAISQINRSHLEKVVLSRVCEVRSEEQINVGRALDYLNQHFRECTRFLFEPRPYHAFYGATPELLARTDRARLETMALAGSAQRGKNSREDEALARQLFNSNKDRHEHRLVIDSIRRRLTSFDVQLQIPSQPEIFTLSYIQHLLTPIEGRLRKPTGILPLLEALHPTPALGGSPRAMALDFIQEAEPVPRGWYAGPIGWIDAHMDGQFAVGIRSAVAQNRRVWLYAGAGIVAQSDPHKEWLETSLKFQPMLAALGIQTDQLASRIKEPL